MACSPGALHGCIALEEIFLGALITSFWISCITSNTLVKVSSVCPVLFIITVALVLASQWPSVEMNIKISIANATPVMQNFSIVLLALH